MSAYATLTLGWPTPPADSLTAIQFLENPEKQNQRPIVLHSCDALFRRCAHGFEHLKSFLIAIGQLTDESRPIECRFDLFSYVFLSRAKNMDLLIPIRPGQAFADESFEQLFHRLRDEIGQLEEFERRGQFPRDESLQHLYIQLREIISRASARDERRVLATMFVSGPITAKNLAQDLVLWENLTTRILFSLSRCRCVASNSDGLYRLESAALAPAYFLVRETLGLSLLEVANDYV